MMWLLTDDEIRDITQLTTGYRYLDKRALRIAQAKKIFDKLSQTYIGCVDCNTEYGFDEEDWEQFKKEVK